MVVAVLEVPVLVSADRIKQLVLVEVQNLLEPGQIRSESRQLTQAED